MKHVIIAANGEPPVSDQHWNRLRKAAPLFCTDGAANWLLAHDITPDVVIGDLDSLEDEYRERLTEQHLRHVPSQENTDLEKAVEYAIEQGYTTATVLGATGKREDQTLANLYLLVKFAPRIHLQYLTNYSVIEVVTDAITFRSEPGQTISLLPAGHAEGITTSGLKYPLHDESLEIGSRGVSNQAVESEISVSVKSGAVIVFRNFR